jgi:hypothetical protein
MTETARYLEPSWFTRNIFNRFVRFLTRHGVSIWGSRELRVRGRVSGEWRTTPVNLLTMDGVDYLVAPRGITQWVRNLRVVGSGELRVGRRVEDFSAVEIADVSKVPILREYLRRWKFEVGAFFPGLDAKSSADQILAVAPGFPVFQIDIGHRRDSRRA